MNEWTIVWMIGSFGIGSFGIGVILMQITIEILKTTGHWQRYIRRGYEKKQIRASKKRPKKDTKIYLQGVQASQEREARYRRELFERKDGRPLIFPMPQPTTKKCSRENEHFGHIWVESHRVVDSVLTVIDRDYYCPGVRLNG